MRLHCLPLASLALLVFLVPGSQVQTASPGKEYVAQIEAARKERDKRFFDAKSSPLGVVAVTKLDGSRMTIGSSPDADLTLSGRGVAPIHAEVVRVDAGNQAFRWLLKPVGGKVVREGDGAPVTSAELRKGERYRLGKQFVYFDQLGTLGPVLRVFDPRAEAFDNFRGLSYFPVDPGYRVEAEVVPNAEPTPLTIVDTHGWSRPGWRYGSARFELEGKELVLHLWLFKRDPGPQDEFFIAFRDKTSGNESYGGGRYLDIPFVKSGRTYLDFNQAYNPSCAYNSGFACPIPPAENRLPAAIRAGEKAFSHR